MSIIHDKDDGDTQQFFQKISQYEDHVLRMTYIYFQDDLQHIVENLIPISLLSELKSRGVPDLQKYLDLENDRKTLARNLLEDICTKDTVIRLWVSLYVLQKVMKENEKGFPSLDAVLEELHCRGKTLVEEIILDKEGHKLPEALIDIQACYKKHLYNESERLKENKPPRCNQEQESFQLSTRYVNLIIVSTDQYRERSENELIETGVKHDKYLKKTPNTLQHISPNKMFRWCHQSGLVPHMVMVIGVPGVGKTTLMQKFVYDWVKGDLYQRFSFVLFFKFRELNSLNEVSLETMILQQYPDLEKQIENILQDPEKLLFIFDGLDESNHTMDFSSWDLCSNPRERRHCGQIVVSLVRKSLLNGCSVLMTSRPTRLASKDCDVFQRIVNITGLSPEERRTYFENFFPDHELAEKAFTYVKQNNTLYTFCYLPSYCWIICTVLSRSFQTTSSDQPPSLLPKTVTQLFAIFVANILANHSLDKSDAQKVLQSLGWMAEHGVMNHRVIFDDRDLDSFHVNNKSKLLSSFLMESGEPGTYTFLHLTVQEFFSALVHYADYSPEKLQESLNRAKFYRDGRGEIFLRFLFGLSDASTRSILKEYLDKQAAQVSIDVITSLKDFLIEEQSIKESEENKERLLRTLFYLFETRNTVLVQESIKSYSCFDLSEVHISDLDCTVLAYILENCQNIKELDLNRCSLTIEGLGRLQPVLRNLQYLSLAFNRLPHTACTQLASIIKNNPSLKILDLSNCHLYGPHFSHLIDALSSPDCRIEELQLDGNALQDTSCTQLASLIKQNQSLKKLVLSGNFLCGTQFRDLMSNPHRKKEKSPPISDLMDALSSPDCRIEELHLADIDLPETYCTQLAYVIRNNRSLKRLDLAGNRLSGPHFGDLMAALSSPDCRIEKLLLRSNNLRDISCTQLASGIRNNRSLKILDLSDNRLSGPHFSAFIDALSSPQCRIEELRMEHNTLSETEKEALRRVQKPNLKINF